MEATVSNEHALQDSLWVVTLDLSAAYFHLYPSGTLPCLRFAVDGHVWQFRVLTWTGFGSLPVYVDGATPYQKVTRSGYPYPPILGWLDHSPSGHVCFTAHGASYVTVGVSEAVPHQPHQASARPSPAVAIPRHGLLGPPSLSLPAGRQVPEAETPHAPPLLH